MLLIFFKCLEEWRNLIFNFKVEWKGTDMIRWKICWKISHHFSSLNFSPMILSSPIDLRVGQFRWKKCEWMGLEEQLESIPLEVETQNFLDNIVHKVALSTTTWSWWLRKYKETSNGNKISSSWRYEDRRRYSFAASFPRRLMPGLRVKRVQRRFDFPRCLYRYPPRDPFSLLSSLPGQEFVLRFRFSGRLVLLWPCTYRLHQKLSR